MKSHEIIKIQNSPELLRAQFIREIARKAHVSDFKILDAFAAVDRYLFVPDEFSDFAYLDKVFPLMEGEPGRIATISQPSIVAYMINHLNLTPDKTVLEVGTGSGYSAAVMSKLSKHVTTLERIPELAETATRRISQLGISTIQVVEADGIQGFQDNGPYDAIVFTAALKQLPEHLLNQLADNGRLLVPVGTDIHNLKLILAEKSQRDVRFLELAGVSFVPTISSNLTLGWTLDEAYEMFRIPETDSNKLTLEQIAQELGISLDDYQELVRKVIGYKDSISHETLEGLSSWIKFLRSGIPGEDLVGNF